MEENDAKRTGEICARSEFNTRPTNEDELHAWVKKHCAIDVPRKAVCCEHDAPFEYLWAAFNEPAKDLIVWAPRGGGKTKRARWRHCWTWYTSRGARCASSAGRWSRA